MKSNKVSLLSLSFFLAIFLIFQSCTEDESSLFESTDNLVNNLDANLAGEETLASQNPRGGDGGMDGLDNDIVEAWTDVLLEVEQYATGMRPNASARALAYIYLAAYETAVPGMREYASTARQLRGLRVPQLPRNGNNINFEIALNETFATTLNHFLINVPANTKSKIDVLQEALEEQLSAGVSQRVVNESKEWGESVANSVIRYGQSDQAAEEQILDPQPRSYDPPTGDGYWTYSADPERALFPYWGDVRTFIISPEETTTVAPLEYSEEENSPYFQQMMEVYNVNNTAREESGEQLWIAEFWSDDVEGLMFSPPARQYAIANQLIDQYELDLEETLALYLKLGFSLNDAAVATWKYKYDYMVMRPNVFIHEFIDPSFQTNLYRLIYWPNPSFPGYPSGHSCFASAAAGVFIDFFGNTTNFTDRSHEGREEFLGAARTFSTFEEMAEENAFSRVPLGVHVRMDCTEGLRLGYEISDAVNNFNLNRDPG